MADIIIRGLKLPETGYKTIDIHADGVAYDMSDGTHIIEEVQQGKWLPILKGEHGYSSGDFRCSCCLTANKCYVLTPYCPNCGAKMKNHRIVKTRTVRPKEEDEK